VHGQQSTITNYSLTLKCIDIVLQYTQLVNHQDKETDATVS